MTSPELDNLVRIGKLKREPPTDDEIAGLVRSAEERLADAARVDLSYSRYKRNQNPVAEKSGRYKARLRCPGRATCLRDVTQGEVK